MQSRAFEMHDDPDEYSLDEESEEDDDDLGELDGVEEEELEKVLRTVAEKEIGVEEIDERYGEAVPEERRRRRRKRREERGGGRSETKQEEENEPREEEDEKEKIETKREDGSIARFHRRRETRRIVERYLAPEESVDARVGQTLLDSADESEWRKWLSTGLFFGVTMNVQLLEKSEKFKYGKRRGFFVPNFTRFSRRGVGIRWRKRSTRAFMGAGLR